MGQHDWEGNVRVAGRQEISRCYPWLEGIMQAGVNGHGDRHIVQNVHGGDVLDSNEYSKEHGDSDEEMRME